MSIGSRIGARISPNVGARVGSGFVDPTPTFVAAGTAASGVGALIPGLPAGIRTGDILILVVNNTFTTIAAATLTDAQSFAAVTGGSINSGDFGGIRAHVTSFWRRYNGSGGNPTVADNGEFNVAQILAFRGCVGTGDPWDEVLTDGDNDGGNTMLLDQLGVPIASNRLAVSFVGGITQASSEVLSGWACVNARTPTVLVNNSYALGEDVYLGAVAFPFSTGFGDLTANWTGAGTYWVSAGLTITLKPYD